MHVVYVPDAEFNILYRKQTPLASVMWLIKLSVSDGGDSNQMFHLVAPEVEHHQVGEQSQLRRKDLQTVERQVQLLQLQQLPQFIWDLLQYQKKQVRDWIYNLC